MTTTGKRPGETAVCDPALIDRLLAAIEDEIVPLTRAGVAAGNKIFGAAILRKADLGTVIAATNEETANPLWHGEMVAIRDYYAMVAADERRRHPPGESVFLATHEPCTMCASAIAWGGYDNFYYLFSHEESRDSFEIGHDLHILKEVFRLEPGTYARRNGYWTGYGIPDLIETCEGAERTDFRARVAAIRATYGDLSEAYQAVKADNPNIPLK